MDHFSDHRHIHILTAVFKAVNMCHFPVYLRPAVKCHTVPERNDVVEVQTIYLTNHMSVSHNPSMSHCLATSPHDTEMRDKWLNFTFNVFKCVFKASDTTR